MSEPLVELFEKLPAYLGGHMLLSMAALGVGLVISLPLGILASRRPKLAEWILGIAGIIQTVPSLALLALMVMLLRGMIGFVPAFLALVLYSILPILANTILGIKGVDPALTEAARGLGMSDRQMLLRVELPLATPVIIGGIRTATVLVVGTATLVTPVGGVSLGNYIFGGLESMNHTATIFGCVVSALLAILLDQLIRLLELAVRYRKRRLAVLSGVGLLLVLAGGLYPAIHRLLTWGPHRGIVASGPFTEQHILSETLTRQLGSAGFHMENRQGMSEGIQMEALRYSQVDCLVNYTGNIWTLLMKRKEFKSSEEIFAEVSEFLQKEHGILCLGKLGFENAYVLAMPKARAETLEIETIEDLGRVAKNFAQQGRPMRIGGDNQIFDRPEWGKVMAAYGLEKTKLETVAMDPALMYGAVADGKVDVIVAYSSDGRIDAFKLETLGDPKKVFPPYDAIILISPQAALKPGLKESLAPLVKGGPINLKLMREANKRADVERQSTRKVAQWLLEEVWARK